ncbi:MoxR family ATPase [Crocosphaera sp. XPORK-15E]|uniref:AAA family ATPase n=1 Tax=Crocosphaera sp. XPORK-15E TaxID=3110247 RepID=UPI002B203310|nr:MoxR family ATPase [Crocosphaera sp. XPORK-15E]MEA5535166.1 MoxR family ATPase [Crocosphaera sp. XPORK-15E]
MTITQEILINLNHNLNKIIVGQPLVIKQLLVALLSGGHVILEGVPGTGKTLLVKVLSKLIQADFRRVQLTPDILPSDILGTNIFDFNSRSFTLQKGPVFTEILLADEINRTPPKTQSALLEAMEEQQVTLDGETLVLSPLFWVAATQNPLEFEGTYPLPEAQLDRFLFKLIIDYPPAEAAKQMLLNFQQGFKGKKIDLDQLETIATVEDILQARQQIQSIKVDDKIIDYLLNLIDKTRQHPDLELGASPRAAVAWLQTSKAQAWFSQRDYVTPDDIKNIASPLLRHRLILKPESQLDGIKIDAVIASLLNQVPVPR